MKKVFDYNRAKAYLGFGSPTDARSGSDSHAGRRKLRFWLWLLVPAVGSGLILASVPGRMPASDPPLAAVPLPADAPKGSAESAGLSPGLQPERGAAAPAEERLGAEDKSVQQDASIAAVQTKEIVVKRGDTLLDLLVREGLARDEAHSIVAAIKPVFNPRRLRKKHALTMTYETADDDSFAFKSLNIKLDLEHEVRVDASGDNGFTAKKIVHEFETRTVRAEFEINSSLYEGAAEKGIPFDMLLPIINIYAYDVDFQRDILAGDHFEIMYTTKVDADGAAVGSGTTAYAALTTQGRRLPLYQYRDSNGAVDYYDAKGRSLKKNLMITPVDGGRISSRYGRRSHPILGYTRMHRGLDFAAPAGTPIKAAGDGVVEVARFGNSFGNNVRLRHANNYKTRYAHMRRFAPGIRAGVRVKQGQIIGYVGSTGLSTGPHLHYEIYYQGQSINPATIKSMPSRILKGRELERFMAAKAELDVQFAALQQPAVFAQLEQPES